MINLSDRIEITLRDRFEYYMTAQGDYKAHVAADGTRRVWKWDGVRWRPRKKVPGPSMDTWGVEPL